LTVRGKAVLVHIEPQSKSPMRIPDALRDKVAAL
jgi:acyl-CoA thioesterase FadM